MNTADKLVDVVCEPGSAEGVRMGAGDASGGGGGVEGGEGREDGRRGCCQVTSWWMWHVRLQERQAPCVASVVDSLVVASARRA